MDHIQLANLYHHLQGEIKESLLKEITAHIIQAYQNQQQDIIMMYGDRLDLDMRDFTINRVFARLMQTYHPDKLAKIQEDLKTAYNAQNLTELQAFDTIYLSGVISDDFHYNTEENYDISQDDIERFGLEIVEEDYFYPMDEETDVKGTGMRTMRQMSFYDALNELMGGTNIYHLSVSDLEGFDNEIDLSDYHIYSLDGVEHCIRVKSLNLSKNHIQDASALEGLDNLEAIYLADNAIETLYFVENLTHLRELDISHNHITDISSLLKLDHLEFVNLIGNPIRNLSDIDQLKSRGVLVVV